MYQLNACRGLSRSIVHSHESFTRLDVARTDDEYFTCADSPSDGSCDAAEATVSFRRPNKIAHDAIPLK